MKTRFPERELGKGTLGYKGETREYYDSKRGLWDVPQAAEGTDVVSVRTADATTGDLVVATASAPEVGSTTSVVALPLGRLAPYDGTAPGRSTALVLLVAGGCMAAYSAYRVARPKAAVTTVLAPDDAYDRRPQS